MAAQTEEEQQLAQPNMLPLHAHHHHHSRSWYARRKVQGAAVAGLACCCVLVFVLAGPKPQMDSDITTAVPVDAKGAAAAAVTAAADKLAQAAAAVGGAGAGCGKVQVDFYGESLCPDCQHMVVDVLAPMFESGVAELMELTYHAFGNVRNNTEGGFNYQHGASEGKYNRYMLCAQHHHPGQKEWFPYVKCFAQNMRSLDAEADRCATSLGWDAAEISSCAEGEGGKELELKAAAATWSLVPPKNFVPWMVVNGVAIGNQFDVLARYVCTASFAKEKPQACYELPENMKYQG